MKILYNFLFLILFLLSSPISSLAQVEVTGFIRNYNAVRLLPEHEIITGRNRLRLNLDHSLPMGKITISNDIKQLYTADTDSVNYQLREAYIDLYLPSSDLRIGKQIISWGRADGTFIADILSPVDATEFLTQDFADLRLGITALKYTRYFGNDYLQLVLNPVFKPNKLPKYEDRWFPSLPFTTSLPIIIRKNHPENTLRNVQLAGRYAFRSNLNYDLDIGLLYWHHPNPRYYKELQFQPGTGVGLRLTEQYTQSIIGLYSGSINLTNRLLLTSESAFYRKRTFDYLPKSVQKVNLANPSPQELFQIGQIFNQNDDGFLIQKPWLISMVGLQYPLWRFNVSGQFINEHIFGYDDEILQEQNFYYATLRLQRSFFRDTFQFTAFSRYNFRGNDFWVNPEVMYSGIDSFEASVGTQLFGGRQPGSFYPHLSFNTYAQNSFAYLKISAYF